MANHSARRSVMQAGRKVVDIGVATPQVMAHRLTRMAFAGPLLSERDRNEFMGMMLEKQQAFGQAWWAACNAAVCSPCANAWAVWHTVMSGQLATQPAAWWKLTEHAWHPAAQIWNAALTPIHSKATSNAKRLSRTRIVQA